MHISWLQEVIELYEFHDVFYEIARKDNFSQNDLDNAYKEYKESWSNLMWWHLEELLKSPDLLRNLIKDADEIGDEYFG